jgi:hypothetical protein
MARGNQVLVDVTSAPTGLSLAEQGSARPYHTSRREPRRQALKAKLTFATLSRASTSTATSTSAVARTNSFAISRRCDDLIEINACRYAQCYWAAPSKNRRR